MKLIDLDKKVYKALQKNLIDEVVEICDEFTDRGLHICSINKSSVLHLAIYHKKYKIADRLLNRLILFYGENSNLLSEKLTNSVDNAGHTLLHAATISNDGVKIAEKLLSLAPNLLESYNKSGETALFSACRHGQLSMFNFLAGQVNSYRQQSFCKDDFFHRSKDGINILHVSISKRIFDLALKIVASYPNLCKEKDSKGMRPLQMLACCPTAFPSGSKPKLDVFNGFIYKILSATGSIRENVLCKPFRLLPCVEQMKQLTINHEKTLKLVRVLVKNDDSWTHSPFSTITLERDDPPKDTVSHKMTRYLNITIEEEPQNAILLAAENGCIEVVKEILDEYPFAIEQFNVKRQNLLHLVIKNRQMDIYDYIKKFHESAIEWMSRDIDDDGNSVLHMVGFLDSSQSNVDAKVTYPVTQLSRDLVLLEELKEKCPEGLSYHKNNDMKTADEMFADNSKKLQEDAKTWLDHTTTQGIVVAGLIVTVIFAAAYQIPGGPNPNGIPNLLQKPFFGVFITTDVISLASALTSIVLFLFIHTSSVELDQFRTWLPMKLLFSFGCLFISVAMMMITFAATVILIVLAEKRRTKIIIYLVVFVPVTVFVFSYIPLYFQLLTNFTKWVCNKINGKRSAFKKQDADQDEDPV